MTHAIDFFLDAFPALWAMARVYLGDGVTPAKPGERLEHADMGVDERWTCSSPDEDRPAHPPMRVPGKEWHFIGPNGPLDLFLRVKTRSLAAIVECRRFDRTRISENVVVVFREGMAFPTKEMVRVVNTAHAVLVVRGENQYHYLRDGFVLSAREEEALVEWGVRRSLFANSLIAVGGTLLVAIVEETWGPAVVGTLLVAAAAYRVQGVLTKVLRVSSPEWKCKHMLVPSGVHGTERVVQSVLVTLVALADLLDQRVVLLMALICASVQVVKSECVGQVCLTWGLETYTIALGVQLLLWGGIVALFLLWVWFLYVFVDVLSWLGVGVLICLSLYTGVQIGIRLGRRLGVRSTPDEEGRNGDSKWSMLPYALVLLASVGVGIRAAVLGWNDAVLKFSSQSLQPWRWPYDDLSRAVPRGLGLIFGTGWAVRIVVGVFAARISGDGVAVTGLGERTLARKNGSPGFEHYDEKPIPSRNLLVPHADQPAISSSLV